MNPRIRLGSHHAIKTEIRLECQGVYFCYPAGTVVRLDDVYEPATGGGPLHCFSTVPDGYAINLAPSEVEPVSPDEVRAARPGVREL